MTTKNDFLFLKKKQFMNKNFDEQQLYSNLNLNQIFKNTNISSIQSDSKSRSSVGKQFVSNPSNDCCHEEKLQFLNKSSLRPDLHSNSSFNSVSLNEGQIQEAKKRWNNSSSLINSNSTLSLHIAAYENNSVVNEEKLQHFGKKCKDTKQLLIGVTSVDDVQNSFEFPRQQEQTQAIITDPEVMQFKASQKLLNPNYNHFNNALKTTTALYCASSLSKKSFLNPVKKLSSVFAKIFGNERKNATTTTAAAKMDKQKLNVIAIENGYGGRHLGCEHSIKTLQASKILNSEDRIPLHWHEIIPEAISGRNHSQLDGVITNSKNLCSAIQKACKSGIGMGVPKKDLLVVGGDHSCAIGTWSGVASSIRGFGDLGLIWIDAHLDSHTPETSPSGNFHGQPVSHLLGYGNEKLQKIGDSIPKLKPGNLVFVGIRSYEPAETEFLQKLGVKIFYDEDITKRGISDVMTEAIDRVSHSTYGFGMSIDLDGFRIVDAPAVGTPEEGGIIASEFLNFIQSHPMKKLLVTELAEFMPEKDDENKTSEKLIANLVEHIYLPRFSRYEIEEKLKQRRQQ